MARFDCTGIEDAINELEKKGEDIGALADEMLLEGAAIVAQEWKASIERHNVSPKAQMKKSIYHPPKAEKQGDVRSIDIYPKGRRRDKNGKLLKTRNAEVAFIRNYGARGGKIPATHFVDEADEKSGEKVTAAFNRMMNEFIEK